MGKIASRIVAARPPAPASALLPLLFAACGPSDGGPDLTVWAHAGQGEERDAIREQVARFADREGLEVDLILLPEGSYSSHVQAAAVAGDLPDVLELDGPYLANLVWQGHLRPLDDLLDGATLAGLLPSVLEQGTIRGALYAIGQFDSGLALYGRRSALEEVGARLPEGPGEAWTAGELEGLLAELAARDSDGAVLDLKLNYPDEWLTYGFSPLLQSAGADLIDRETLEATGTLDGPAAVTAMGRVRGWFERGLIDPNLDDNAFCEGRVPLSWVGHWEYERYSEAFGKDLLLLPLPDFGAGARTGQGSWCFTMTAACPEPERAARLLEFLLETEQVSAMTAANGAVPATRAAVDASPRYRAGGALHLYVAQLEGGFSVPRPRTPAYPVISSAFAQALRDIRDGRPVEEALGEAAATIDRDLRDNNGYPWQAAGDG